jgi:hypothetical protein
MKSRILMSWSITGLLAAGAAVPAIGADCSGYDVLVTQSADTIDVGGGHTATVIRWWSVLTTDDPKSPYNLATGECQGSLLTTPDGKTQATGYCARRDKDKDTQSIQWTIAPGAEKGEWRATGGTGKFAGRSDAGWFQGVNADGKMSISRWGGKCR